MNKMLSACISTLILTLPPALSADEQNQPIRKEDLPLPVIVDPSQGDVPITLDGEIVEITGAVEATLQEPIEVEGAVNATVTGDVNATVTNDINANVLGTVPVTVENFPPGAGPTALLPGDLFYFAEGGSRLNGDPAGTVTSIGDFILPPYLTRMDLRLANNGVTCELDAIAYDAADGAFGTGPIFALGSVESLDLDIPTLRDIEYPAPVDFSGFIDPMVRFLLTKVGSGTDPCGFEFAYFGTTVLAN